MWLYCRGRLVVPSAKVTSSVSMTSSVPNSSDNFSESVETFLLINASSCFLFAFTCFPSLSLSLCFHFCFPYHKPLMSLFHSYFFIIIFFLLLPTIYPWRLNNYRGERDRERNVERERERESNITSSFFWV